MKLEDIRKEEIINIKRKEIINVKGKGRMLVQYISPKNIVLMGRVKNSPTSNSIISIEINPANIFRKDNEIILNKPYEINGISDSGEKREFYAELNKYLKESKL